MFFNEMVSLLRLQEETAASEKSIILELFKMVELACHTGSQGKTPARSGGSKGKVRPEPASGFPRERQDRA